MSSKKIPTLSLFSGAGGLDLGFDAAGFDIRACVELEEKYCKTLHANIKKGKHFSPDTRVFNTDITKFDETEFLADGIECIIGGPPCQTFSAAGRRSGGVIGTEDVRGQLYSIYCRILDTLKPKVFVFENVYGMPGANGGKPWQEIVAAFSEHGYSLFHEVVDSADYGVPQHRERLIMIGLREGTYHFPLPTHGPDSKNDLELVSVLDAIRDLQDPKEPYHDNLGGMYGHLLPDVPEGLNYAFYTAEMGHPEPVFAWRSKFHDLLYKVNPAEPCRTIKAQPGKFTGPFHWKNRHFTPAELKRLQTFPDDYVLQGSYAVQLEQIGNSVPPRLAFCIARSVREQVFDKPKELSIAIRPQGFKSTFRQRQRERSKNFKDIALQAIAQKYGRRSKRRPDNHASTPNNVHIAEYSTLFSRKLTDNPNKSIGESARVTVSDIGNTIDIDFESLSRVNSLGDVYISITGLRKYLPHYDNLNAKCKISSLVDIFHVWKEIELALTKRSKFFTLIDIYGHYANRGDVVDIQSKFDLNCAETPIVRALEYFSQTKNCGDFVGENELSELLDIDTDNFASLSREFRKLRYDFRSFHTHPIIGQGRYLCTYPFPLLSPRALVESRVEFNGRDSGSQPIAEVVLP